ncbi:MAG: PAS domain S-box protein, partial [Chloroflexi bacterium]|nr:PAS domain S-box protein [Chloroflexota bacterium]
DETMQILMINQAAAHMFGFASAEEVHSINPFDFIPQEERERVLETVAKDMFEHDRKQINEFRLIHKAGKEVWVSAVGTVIEYQGKPAGLISFRDITNSKEAEKIIDKQREEYRTIFDSVRPAITYIDKDGAVQRINKAGATFFGLKPKELIGKTAYDLFPAAQADQFSADNNEVISSGIPKIGLVTEYSLPSGEKRWTQTDRIPYLDEHGDAIGVIEFDQDITRRKIAEEKLIKSYESLKKTLNDAINTMAKIVEIRDPYTSGHQHKVADLATAIAREMKLEDTRIDQLKMAAVIHDIGKMSVPSDILSKPGKLSDIEFSLIKTHSQSGYDIVKSMDFPCSVAEIVLQHHERLDGSGYPNNLKGEDTLLEAKILVVADVIEAMASDRPYRPALGIEKALEEISKNRGKLYDPGVADACMEVFKSGKFEFKSV